MRQMFKNELTEQKQRKANRNKERLKASSTRCKAVGRKVQDISGNSSLVWPELKLAGRGQYTAVWMDQAGEGLWMPSST